MADNIAALLDDMLRAEAADLEALWAELRADADLLSDFLADLRADEAAALGVLLGEMPSETSSGAAGEV